MSPAKQKSAGKTRSRGKAAASGDGKAPAVGKEKGMPQSAAMPSPFPPIADYAFLSNCHTGALVAPDGAIDWLCVPRFDSPSVFGTLLDREAGSFRFGPFGINVPSARIYEPGTNILNTTWHTPTGWAMVRDALTIGPTQHEDEVTPHTRRARRRGRPPPARANRRSAWTARWTWSCSTSPTSTTGARRPSGRCRAATPPTRAEPG